MTYLLDTTAFSAMMRRDAKIRGRISTLSPEDQVVVCTITRGEILYGLERLPQGKRRSDLTAESMPLFTQLACLAIPETAGDRYARIKAETERKGARLDENDLWIAATALSVDAVLVTMDSDFRRIINLAVEDWTQ